MNSKICKIYHFLPLFTTLLINKVFVNNSIPLSYFLQKKGEPLKQYIFHKKELHLRLREFKDQ